MIDKRGSETGSRFDPFNLFIKGELSYTSYFERQGTKIKVLIPWKTSQEKIGQEIFFYFKS